MITKTFSATNQYSAPVFLSKDQVLAVSISGSTWSGTIAIQRLIPAEGSVDYPGPSDASWFTQSSHTANMEDQVAQGDNCWYRAFATLISSGTPKVIIKAS